MSGTDEVEVRRVRAAKNQSLLSEVNERIEELTAGEPSPMFEELRMSRTLDLACECMDDTCTERITMTVSEYEQIRSGSNAFFVKPGHQVPDVEVTVREEAEYIVVSKIGAGATVAEKLDR